MKFKHGLLLFLIPLSEAKALFYSSNKRVSWYLFSENKRLLCNVVEDYSNILIMGTVFFYMTFLKLDILTKQISFFLFLITVLDFIHLGLMDMQYFIALKLVLAFIILKICNKLKIL